MTLIRVAIQTANDNQPQFLQNLYTAAVVENVPTETPVVTITARDKDEVSSNVVKVTFV